MSAVSAVSSYGQGECKILSQRKPRGGVVNVLQTQHPQALLLISGDFNHVSPSSTLSTFTQYVTCHTRDNKILDLFYANTKEAYNSSPLPPLERSDHNLVHLLPVYKPLVHREPAVTRTVKKWSKETEEALKDCFETTVWEELCDPNGEDIDSLTHCITDYVNFCVENTVPTKTVRCFSNNKPWINPDIKALLKKKKRAFRSGDKDELKAVQRELRRKIREGKAGYRKKLEEELQQNNVSGVWKGLKTISGHKKPDSQVVGDQKWVNELNLFFNRFDHSHVPPPTQTSQLNPPSVAPPTCCPPPSLTLTPLSQPPPTGSSAGNFNFPFTHSNTQPPCSNLSFTTAQVRNELKKIKVKKAAGPDGISARLLKSCADQLCRVVEHMFNLTPKGPKQRQTSGTDFTFDEITGEAGPYPSPPLVSPSMDPLQFAYQPGVGVDDAIIHLLHGALSHLEKPGSTVRITFFDFSSAFNTIQPGLLKDKLDHIGVDSHLSNWILDYLSNRPQYVRAWDCVSDMVVSSTGAPQGTVLAPFLFTLYTADFMYRSPDCHLQKFSDDSAIVGLINNDEDSEYRGLIQDFVDWCLQNHLQLNVGKTKELVVDFRSYNESHVFQKVPRLFIFRYFSGFFCDLLDEPFGVLVIRTSCALLDRTVEESFPVQLYPNQSKPNEESQGIFQTPSITSCDFESACSWTLSNHSDHGDWFATSPQQHRVGQQDGHPTVDHSVGDSKGHFLVLRPGSESGSCTFHITSPVILNSGLLCRVRLAYFQLEPSIGNLSVSVKPINSVFAKSNVFVRKENVGMRESWEVLEALIGKVDEPFRVTVEYTSCSGHDVGLLAIDSLELKDCNGESGDIEISPSCKENSEFHCDLGGCIDKSRVCDFHVDCPLGEDEGFICDKLPLGSYCSFESGTCGWSVSDRQSSWMLSSGEQLAESADLLGTTLQNTQGHFLFFKVRENANDNEAFIYSPALPSTLSSRDCQLHFSLYLYGDFNGTVVLSVVENLTSVTPLIWRTGQWKDDWQTVTLQIKELLNGFRLKVHARWNEGSQADIAVDDISLSAACFDTDLRVGLLSHEHNSESSDKLDFLSPLPEPSALEASQMTWWFTSCGASGPWGPTQAQCDSAYRNTNVSVLVGKEGPLRGVQMWRVPATNRYKLSAYGAAGGKGAKNHNKRSHGVIISAIFTLEKGDALYLLIGHQGEDACPGRNPLTHRVCLGESSVIEDGFEGDGHAMEWAGGGGGGGGATFIFRMENGKPVPLLIAAGGGGKAYLEDPDSSLDEIPLEQYENDTVTAGLSGRTGAAGGGGGWKDSTTYLWAGKSLFEGAEGGSPCPQALSKLGWATFGGFGGGGGACTAGGSGGGYRGGDASHTDDITADGQDGISFVHPSGELFLQPLAAMESHGEAEIEVHLNCSHCQTQSCKRDKDSRFIICLCHNEELLAPDNVTCIVQTQGSVANGHLSLSLIMAVVASTLVTGIVLTCACLILMYYRKKNHLHAVRVRLQSPEHKLSKIRSTTIMTDYNPNYCFAGKVASLSELKEVPRKNITLLRALGHGAFGEVYEGQVFGMNGENTAMQVAVKTLPEICSEQDEMDFLMETLIMSKFNHQNIVCCIGVSLQILPRFILLELMTGGDMKSFLRQTRPKANQPSSLTMLELLQMARDIAFGCRYLEENHFIHRDIAARNCLLTCTGPERVAKIGDFGMARDIYRASYYRKGGRAMLPVKWMPPEAFLEGIFTCKTDTWSFGVLLWEIFSLGYMPYPCRTNQEVLEFVTSGGRMDPPKKCPGPVYRIMTQCWQHCPEHRPNFSAILERLNYCTQDPDVINTPLPVECGPAADEDSSTVIRPVASSSMSPLLIRHSMSQELPVHPGIFPSIPQVCKPSLLPQWPSHVPQEMASSHEALEPCWTEPLSAPGACSSSWLQVPVHQPCSRASSSSGSQKLKNNTKNLWNPTYGSWVLESFGQGKTSLLQTQSMPLSSTSTMMTASIASITSASEHNDSGTETNASPCSNTSPAPSQMSSSPSGSCCLTTQKVSAGTAVYSISAAMDLAKLHSFTCGNMNYSYDEQSYEAETLPFVVARSSEPSSSAARSSLTVLSLASYSTHKPLIKRHASYGHEDVGSKPEKPTRDRDSGFSLSEDLSVPSV
ncbi:tyrosine-protein kinase receptor [Trichomycterus rosablanca]|uniref:tyrosine-protein kinase receptor n=1 Tax=Trichomycterus rosablanca TaxID=2290929 RepID=UPI002F35188F